MRTQKYFSACNACVLCMALINSGRNWTLWIFARRSHDEMQHFILLSQRIKFLIHHNSDLSSTVLNSFPAKELFLIDFKSTIIEMVLHCV